MGGKKSKTDFPEQNSAVNFYRFFRKKLSDEELYCLKYLFYTINVSKHQISQSFFKFLTNKGFAQMYEAELNKFKTIDIANEGDFQESLPRHCFAVIGIHFAIIRNIDSPKYVHALLKEIATCHCLLRNVHSFFKFHDELLYKFIKKEFHKYHNPFTLKALQKYLRLISDRIIFLASAETKSSSQSNIIQQIQKITFPSSVEELSNLHLIFIDIAESQVSQLSFAQPGPSSVYNNNEEID